MPKLTLTVDVDDETAAWLAQYQSSKEVGNLLIFSKKVLQRFNYLPYDLQPFLATISTSAYLLYRSSEDKREFQFKKIEESVGQINSLMDEFYTLVRQHGSPENH